MFNFVEVSFAVHADIRSHTGCGASFGRGVFLPMSRKQRINTGSSTEGEVVGVADYAPNTIWLLKFLEAQGCKPNLCVLFQYNEAAIKMLKKGKKSSSRRTRYLDIKLFNIKISSNRKMTTAEFQMFVSLKQSFIFYDAYHSIYASNSCSIVDIKLSKPTDKIGSLQATPRAI